MALRRLLLSTALGGLLPGAARAMTSADKRSDRISFPAEKREFRAPGWLLQIESLDAWQSPAARAQLWQTGTETRLRWSRSLEHSYGPRDALINAQGQVLLIDEWINVSSKRALMLIGTEGRIIATHAYADIVAALRTTPAAVSSKAKRGPWLAGDAQLSADGRQVRIAVAGQVLLIDLQDGRLSVAAP